MVQRSRVRYELRLCETDIETKIENMRFNDWQVVRASRIPLKLANQLAALLAVPFAERKQWLVVSTCSTLLQLTVTGARSQSS
jgi:hypothetical protein